MEYRCQIGWGGATRANMEMSEEEILAATVGGQRPLNSSIHLSAYDPEWPSQFARLEGRIRAALGEAVRLLEHVGSTAVPGLPAKPIIDIVLAVVDSSDEAAYVDSLKEQGFTLRIREPGWHEHRMLKAPGGRGNLHVFSDGCKEIERMILFRDWLRENEQDRKRYQETKRELAARTWKYTQNYADAKSEVIEEMLTRARAGKRGFNFGGTKRPPRQGNGQ